MTPYALPYIGRRGQPVGVAEGDSVRPKNSSLLSHRRLIPLDSTHADPVGVLYVIPHVFVYSGREEEHIQ